MRKKRNQLETTGLNGLKLPVGQQIPCQLFPRVLLDAGITAKNDPMDPEAVLMLFQELYVAIIIITLSIFKDLLKQSKLIST